MPDINDLTDDDDEQDSLDSFEYWAGSTVALEIDAERSFFLDSKVTPSNGIERYRVDYVDVTREHYNSIVATAHACSAQRISAHLEALVMFTRALTKVAATMSPQLAEAIAAAKAARARERTLRPDDIEERAYAQGLALHKSWNGADLFDAEAGAYVYEGSLDGADGYLSALERLAGGDE
jgi:hypothetical protein